MHRRAAASGVTPYEVGRTDALFPVARIWEAADVASSRRLDSAGRLVTLLADGDPGVRYWGAVGLLIRGETDVRRAHGALTAALADVSPSVASPSTKLKRASEPMSLT